MARHDCPQALHNRVRIREYLAKMMRDGEWVDTWKGAQCERADFQEHSDETLVGEDLMESTGDGHAALVVPVALVKDHHFWGVVESQEEVIIAPVDKGEYAAFRSPGGLGIQTPVSGMHAMSQVTLTMGSRRTWPTRNQLSVALLGWSPWDAPSESLLRAMAMVQRAWGHVTTVDTTATCMRRAEAVTELLYEAAHYANLPESCRCRRLARRRLQGCP